MRKQKGHDLGAGASILARFLRCCDEMHEDAAMWGAPSECHTLIEGGNKRAFRRVRRQIKATTGLEWQAFHRELCHRTSSRWVHFNLHAGMLP